MTKNTTSFLVEKPDRSQLFRETSEKNTQVHATGPKGSMGRSIEQLHMLNTNECNVNAN